AGSEVALSDLECTLAFVVIFLLPFLATQFVLFSESASWRQIIPYALLIALGCIGILIASFPSAHAPLIADYVRLALSVIPLFIGDVFIRTVLRVDRETGWCLLHAFTNLLVIITAWEDVIFIFLNPHLSLDPPTLTVPPPKFLSGLP